MVGTRLEPRPFGRTGLQVTPLALADMSFGRRGLPSTNRLSPEDVERASFDYGVTAF